MGEKLSRSEISKEEVSRRETALGLGLHEDASQAEIDALYDWYENLPDAIRDEVNDGGEKWFDEYTRRNQGESVKEEDSWNEISSADAVVLSNAGFNSDGAKEVEVGGVGMIEIPRRGGPSAFVRKENLGNWIEALKDQGELKSSREDAAKAYGEAEGQLEDSAEEERQQFERLKMSLYDLAESVKRLYNGLALRDNERFSPLIHPDEINRLLSSAQGLENVADNIKVDRDYVEGAVGRMTQAIEEMGNVSSRGEVNEDEDSLTGIGFFLQAVEDQCAATLGVVGSTSAYDTTPLKKSVSGLFDAAQKGRLFVGRKLQAYRDYRY